jgi:hypothetical protein
VAGGVGVFSGEEEGICHGFGHKKRSVEASGGDVTVGSEGVWVAVPVVGVDAEELALDLCGF